MKKIRYIFSFLNKKKGVFALGLCFGIVFGLFFTHVVFASNDSNLFCVGFFHGMTLDYNYYANYDFSFENTAGYKCNDGGAVLTNVENAVFRVIDSNGGCNDFVQDHADVYSLNTEVDIDYGEIYVYMFSSRTECLSYLNGEIDASSALNYEEVQNANRSFSYDSDLPYYDKTSLSLNADNTCLLDANMSDSQRDLYNSFSTDSGSPFMIELYSHAIYAKTTDLGNFNAFVLMYGTENNLGNKLPNAKKVDEIIKFDSSGRLIVNGEQGFMGGGGRHGDSFSISDSSPLIAYTFEQVTFRDGLSATSHFTRDVSYVSTEIDGYILIGYMTEICLVYPDGNDVRYGRKTYSYTWLTRALRERYGSQSSFYDGDGAKFEGEDYVFDEYGKEVDSTYSGGNLNNDNVIDYIKNGYGLSGTDGYIEMSRRFFIGVPDFIWGIIAFALSINVIVILFKVLRGM